MRVAKAFFAVASVIVASSVFGLSYVSAQTKPAAQHPLAPSLAAALNTRLDLDFADTPLVDAIDYLQEQTGIPFILRAKKLEEAGVNVDVPVNAHHRQIRLETWLNLALGELDLTWMEQDDLIVITTPEDAEVHLITRVYDCRDLLAIPPGSKIPGQTVVEDTPNGESAPTERTQPDAPAGKSPANQPAVGCGSYDPRPLRPADPAEHLMEIVTRAVDIQSWEAVGGAGTIGEYRGMLVVTQTDRVHKKVAHLLDMLREAAGLEVPKTGKVVR